MQKETVIEVFKNYDDYLDTLLGLNDNKELMNTLLDFRNQLRINNPEWSKQNYINSEIEAESFLKYMELCQIKK